MTRDFVDEALATSDAGSWCGHADRLAADLLSRLSRLAQTYPTAGVQDTVRDAVTEIERLRADGPIVTDQCSDAAGAPVAITMRQALANARMAADAEAAEVERLRKDRDDWQALCAATGCDLEAMRRERNALAELLREARPFLWSSLGRSVDAVLGKEQP